MSFFNKSKKGKGEDFRKSSLSEDSELTEGSVNSGARKTSGAEKPSFFDKQFNRGGKVTPTLDSSKGSQDGQQPSESDPHHDGPTTETESHQEAKVSEQLDTVGVVELDHEPKSKPSTSAAASSQMSVENELELILQTLSTLQDYILKKEWEKTAMAQEIVELKKHVALLEDRLNENQKQLHEKVDWYSNQLMKCDKQREALEGEVSVLKSEKEALKNDAIKQDKELSTAVAALKLRDEQYVAVDQVLVGLKDELNQLHTTISALKADLVARQDQCEVLKKQIAKDSEMLEEYSHQISDLSTTLSEEKEEKALVYTKLKKAEADMYKKDFESERYDRTRLADQMNKSQVQQVHTIPFLEGLDQRIEKGRGSFGAVYKVKLNGLPCIAKGLHEILLGLGENYQVAETDIQAIRQKFLIECVLLSKLKHPNIVQFLGIHSTKENEYLVMEYMHMDLAVCLKTYRDIPASVKVSILHDVSYGLLHLHSQDPPIIHRDLTATNILLTQDMRAKIADLGVSKIFDLQRVQTASLQTIAPGTKAYMPPEALRPDPKYDLKLDIFSFGVLALYTAIQEFPIEFEHKITAAVFEKQEVQIYRRMDSIEKMGMDHPLHPLVIKCLQDRPELRPTTKELCEMIASILSQYKKEWNNVLELYIQNQTLKRESDIYRKQLGATSRNEGPSFNDQLPYQFASQSGIAPKSRAEMKKYDQ